MILALFLVFFYTVLTQHYSFYKASSI